MSDSSNISNASNNTPFDTTLVSVTWYEDSTPWMPIQDWLGPLENINVSVRMTFPCFWHVHADGRIWFHVNPTPKNLQSCQPPILKIMKEATKISSITKCKVVVNHGALENTKIPTFIFIFENLWIINGKISHIPCTTLP